MSGRAKQDKMIKETLKLGENDSFIPFSSISKKGREDVYRMIESALNS